MARPKATIEPARLVRAFADRGLQGTSSDELAAAAGVSKPTLYAHGHTKETLFLLAVEVEVERLLERLHRAERLMRGRSARDRATGAAHAILNHGAARHDGLRLLIRAVNEPGATAAGAPTVGNPSVMARANAAVARIPNRLCAVLQRDLAADGLDPTLAPTLATAIWGAARALTLNPIGERRPNRERVAAIVAACVPARPPISAHEWPAAS